MEYCYIVAVSSRKTDYSSGTDHSTALFKNETLGTVVLNPSKKNPLFLDATDT